MEPKSLRKTPWQLVLILLLLAAGLVADRLVPAGLRPFLAGAFFLLCAALLVILWRMAVSAYQKHEQTRWDEANKAMTGFIQVLIDIMPNPAFFKDLEGRYLGTNAGFEKLLGRSKSELIGKTIGDVAPAEIVETDFRLPDGRIAGIIGILRDITQRLRSEEEIEQLRRFSESTAQTMTEGLVLTDAEGRFTFVNPAAARMLGYTPAEMIDRHVLSFVPREQHSVVQRADEKRSKGISDRYELTFTHRDGSPRTVLVSGGPRIQGAQFGGTMAVLTDITDRKRMEDEIRSLSLHDELTGLFNRRGFMTFADHVLKTANRLKKATALLYLDVDNLKTINDTGGHKLGDRALVEIGFVLRKSFRETDIIGRLGGDEFAVLAMEATAMNAGAFSDRLQERLEQFNARSSAEAGFVLSISTGVAIREPDQPLPVEEMLSRADLLMYERKRAKKGGAMRSPGLSK